MARMTFSKMIGASLCFWLMALCAKSNAASPRTTISSAHVADAITQAGIKVRSDQVEFLSAISSVHPVANLHVVRVVRLNPDLLKVRLRCDENSECLPFYVLLRGKTTGEISDLKKLLEEGPTAPKATRPVVRGGDSATLIVQTQNMQMTLPVICLQNGRLGERIKVASPDRKRTFEAEVVRVGLVRRVL
jgi:flagella basal body P-ring formation protein FlgA